MQNLEPGGGQNENSQNLGGNGMRVLKQFILTFQKSGGGKSILAPSMQPCITILSGVTKQLTCSVGQALILH